MIFEWDQQKAKKNFARHRIAFDEASTIFGDPLSLTVHDPIHSAPREQRFVIIGKSVQGRTLIAVFTERGRTIRIISARAATGRERKQYEEGL